MSSLRDQLGEVLAVWAEVQHEGRGCWAVKLYVRRRRTYPPPPGHDQRQRTVREHVDSYEASYRPTRGWAERTAARQLRSLRRQLAREDEHAVLHEEKP